VRESVSEIFAFSQGGKAAVFLEDAPKGLGFLFGGGEEDGAWREEGREEGGEEGRGWRKSKVLDNIFPL
jgi:hypothetical protein